MSFRFNLNDEKSFFLFIMTSKLIFFFKNMDISDFTSHCLRRKKKSLGLDCDVCFESFSCISNYMNFVYERKLIFDFSQCQTQKS